MLIALILFALVVTGILVTGFYRGWFSLASLNDQGQSSATLSLNKDKIKADKNKAVEQVHDLGQEAVDKIVTVKK
jgi:Flp pilus assembly protein TadG